MALIKVGESYNMPAKIYYCETYSDFSDNFQDNDSTTPGTQVYIIRENLIKVKGEKVWGDYGEGSTTTTTSGGVEIYYAGTQEGF